MELHTGKNFTPSDLVFLAYDVEKNFFPKWDECNATAVVCQGHMQIPCELQAISVCDASPSCEAVSVLQRNTTRSATHIFSYTNRSCTANFKRANQDWALFTKTAVKTELKTRDQAPLKRALNTELLLSTELKRRREAKYIQDGNAATIDSHGVPPQCNELFSRKCGDFQFKIGMTAAIAFCCEKLAPQLACEPMAAQMLEVHENSTVWKQGAGDLCNHLLKHSKEVEIGGQSLDTTVNAKGPTPAPTTAQWPFRSLTIQGYSNQLYEQMLDLANTTVLHGRMVVLPEPFLLSRECSRQCTMDWRCSAFIIGEDNYCYTLYDMPSQLNLLPGTGKVMIFIQDSSNFFETQTMQPLKPSTVLCWPGHFAKTCQFCDWQNCPADADVYPSPDCGNKTLVGSQNVH